MAARSSSMLLVKSRVAHMATCPICLELFDKPRSLPCLHTFCLKCLEDHFKDKVEGERVQCAVCRHDFNIPRGGLATLPHDFKMQSLVELREHLAQSQVQMGTMQVKPPVAPPRPQSLVPGQERHSGSVRSQVCSTNCVKHTDKPLELYCFTCSENICMKCAIVNHRQHECKEIEEYADELLKQIDKHIENIQLQISQTNEEVKQLETENKKLLQNIETTESSIKQKGEEIKQLVDRHVGQLITELQSIKTQASKEIMSHQQRLELELEKMQSFCEHCKQLKANSQPSDVTYSAPKLQTQAAQLLKANISTGCCRTSYVELFEPDTQLAKVNNLVGQLTVLNIAVQPPVNLTFREAGPVRGLSLLDDELFVLGEDVEGQIEVYDASTCRLLRRMSVPSEGRLLQLESCKHNLCLYVADLTDKCVHRLEVKQVQCTSTVSKWSVGDEPLGLSVTQQFTLLVTMIVDINEFTTTGQLLREIILQPDIVNPMHAILCQSNGHFLVCHGDPNSDSVRRVCIVDETGHVVKSFGGSPVATTVEQLSNPRHLAVDKNGFIYVADSINSRVLLLSPSLNFVREVVSNGPIQWDIIRLLLDDDKGKLYLAEDKWDDEDRKYIKGRVVVVNLL